MTNSEKSNKIDTSKKHFMTPGQYIIVFFLLFIAAIPVIVWLKGTGPYHGTSSAIPFPEEKLADASGEVIGRPWLADSAHVQELVGIINSSTVKVYLPARKKGLDRINSNYDGYIEYYPAQKSDKSRVFSQDDKPVEQKIPANVIIVNSQGLPWEVGEKDFCVQGTGIGDITVFQTNIMKKPLLGTCPNIKEEVNLSDERIPLPVHIKRLAEILKTSKIIDVLEPLYGGTGYLKYMPVTSQTTTSSPEPLVVNLPITITIYNSEGRLWSIDEKDFCIQGTNKINYAMIFQTNTMDSPQKGTCPNISSQQIKNTRDALSLWEEK